MKTQAFPYKEIAPHTYEIGEFDCASMFLLVGGEKAMLIDTGVGIGDLKGFVATLTGKPLMVCCTHDHVDHVGGASAFESVYVHPRDMPDFANGGGIGLSVEGRRGYVQWIAEREKGVYPYNLAEDLSEWGPCPPLYPLQDEQVIDLGQRKVTVYACHGHTPGSITLLDENTRILFLGDACNCNLLLTSQRESHRFVSLEKTLFYLKRLHSLRGRYERCFNGHYDFRALGEPLGADVLPDAIAACEQILAGTAVVTVAPARLPGGRLTHSVTVGRTRVSFNPDGIREI
jgi:glyoxylase-like metal-dependent hydrolase (beta-lactamase superfamily II)